MNKNETIKTIIDLIVLLTENKEVEEVPNKSAPQTVEMLTIKECLEVVSGITESMLRRLITTGKIPFIRAGDSERGKILIKKTELLNYFNSL
jgi:hypothetical protein